MSKLISTDEYFLLVFETAPTGLSNPTVSRSTVGAINSAVYWSKKLNCHVGYSEPGDVFMVLKEDKTKHLLKVLHRNRVGWISSYGWIGLKEIKS